MPVILIDVIKTIIPVLFGGWIFAHFYDMPPSVMFPFGWFISESFFGQTLAGFAVMLGHCFPLFYKFKGGKGVMAVGAIVIVIDWRIAIIAWGIFILVAAVSRYVSLGALLGTLSVPATTLFLSIGGRAELCVIFLCVLLVFVRHAENIVRLSKGEESKFVIKRKADTEDSGQ